jgi:hypothetical protein
MNRSNVSVVVLSRGAHYLPDDIFIRQYNETLSFLRRHYPHVLVLCRSTASGHANCDKTFLSAPHRPPPAEPGSFWDNFNWKYFARQNAQLQQLIMREYSPQMVFVDIDFPTQLRPDSHVIKRKRSKRKYIDCLHYCPGSVTSYWLEMLLNTIVLAADLSWPED